MKILNKILYWAFVIFVIYIIYQVILKIIGGSWQLESLIIVLLSANLGYSFYLTRYMGEINSKLSEHMGWHKGKKNSH